MWKIVIVIGFVCVAIIANQLGYEVDYKRLEMVYYQRSLVRNPYFFFGKYNRTNYCLNVSFELLQDLDGNHIESTNSANQLINGEYRPLGMQITFNVCDHYKKNLFGIQTQLAQYGNLTACNIKKGFYYMYNFMPDESYFPKSVPLGDYMVQMDVRRDTGESLLKFRWFISAKIVTIRNNRKNRRRKN